MISFRQKTSNKNNASRSSNHAFVLIALLLLLLSGTTTATATATATSPTEKENGGVVVGLRGKGVKGTKSTESRIIKKEAEEEEQRPRKLSYMERPPDCPINDPPTCVGHPPACVVMGECCGASDRLLEYCFCSGSSYSCTAMCGKC
eukprot:CAMPEP_0116555338 /NCGR_PEP_ID=MMETSP0397-20121206/8097_1 /TAXON_ID=216820 /ORGANISM="Cyclophora tenuis, Strain ECT3854" /LENGTH=146 /DNA_ID=CAMNT_0004080609 /DNA_START=13 /DNA_END=453 /DNA_ORIENTATION=-